MLTTHQIKAGDSISVPAGKLKLISCVSHQEGSAAPVQLVSLQIETEDEPAPEPKKAAKKSEKSEEETASK
jgi:hypothetical protein